MIYRRRQRGRRTLGEVPHATPRLMLEDQMGCSGVVVCERPGPPPGL